MTLPRLLTPDEPASRALAVADPALGALIERVCRVEVPVPQAPFRELVSSIVGQQLSAKAAATIWKRMLLAVDPTPEALAVADTETLRAAGLSRAKTEYVQGIARAVLSGEIDLEALAHADDEQVIAQLTRLRGVGRWTAEMHLIFALGRPDVLALDDLGVRASAGRMLGLDRAATRDELAQRGELWRPHRSTASLWLWGALA